MICNVFKPKRKINGRLHVGRLYRGRYKLDGEFRMTTIPLHTTDKQLAQQRLLLAVRQREKELSGLAGRKPLREATQSPLLNHLDDFLADLRARKRSESHIKHIDTPYDDCAVSLERQTVGRISFIVGTSSNCNHIAQTSGNAGFAERIVAPRNNRPVLFEGDAMLPTCRHVPNIAQARGDIALAGAVVAPCHHKTI